eukprot:gene13848-29466_t
MLIQDDDDGPLLAPNDDLPQKFNLRSLDELKADQLQKKKSDLKPEQQSKSTENKGSATFGYLSIDDLKGRMIDKETKPYYAGTQMPETKLVDLNGIDPWTPLSFSILPAIMCYVGYMGSTYMGGHFAVNYLTSEFYPVQRIAIVARNVIVGLFMMATGFSGIVSIGLFFLGVTVAIGVAKGELNPNQKKEVEK